VPKIPKRPREWLKYAKSHSRPQSLASYEEARFSGLVHSEIRRRRLAERVFAFLFNDTQATQQSTKLEYENLKDMVTGDQLLNCSEPFLTKWRQENESWNAVEQYISSSEWHMNSLKLELLGGLLGDGDGYKEIVII
jgi:hypothetical protein